jgi:nicotinamidase-related amidase
VAAIAPAPDEIVLPKTSSSVFNSTILDYVLRNIGIDAVIAAGFLTDQCVDHAIRDGADRGYEMICLTDGCATKTKERHEAALNAFKGYCRLAETAEILAEIGTPARP